MTGAGTTNRIDARLERLMGEGRKALVIYATSGDPTPDASRDVFRAAAAGGADIIEIGVPFSDPTADGPAIQAASERALERGGGLESAIADARAVRESHREAGVILFGYANPFLASTRRGLGLPGEGAVRETDLAGALRDAGADGVLCVDLPPEEDRELGPALSSNGLHSIRLVTPVSTDARIRAAIDHGAGFLYCVSVTGVTGGAAGDAAVLERLVVRIRKRTERPVVIGFGIATPADAVRMAAVADGAVVGSAIVRLVAEHGTSAPAKVEAFVRTLRRALDGE